MTFCIRIGVHGRINKEQNKQKKRKIVSKEVSNKDREHLAVELMEPLKSTASKLMAMIKSDTQRLDTSLNCYGESLISRKLLSRNNIEVEMC